MSLLLDTSAYSALMRGDPAVADLVRDAEDLLLSAIVAGELLFGFRRGSRLEANLRKLESFLANAHVSFVAATRTTADRFGRIAAGLREKGTPIPSNDIWIAAHTLETGAELVSFDQHFAAIDNLPWICPGGGKNVS